MCHCFANIGSNLAVKRAIAWYNTILGVQSLHIVTVIICSVTLSTHKPQTVYHCALN